MEPVVLATLASATSVLGNEYLKGTVEEAGKSTWNAVKSLLGWKSDPSVAEIPQRVTEALSASPDLAVQLLKILKTSAASTATAMVDKIDAAGGKVVVAHTVNTTTFQM